MERVEQMRQARAEELARQLRDHLRWKTTVHEDTAALLFLDGYDPWLAQLEREMGRVWAGA